MKLSELKMSSIVKIAAAVAIGVIIIMQALQSNKEDKLEKITSAIMDMEQKVDDELKKVESEVSPHPSTSPSPSLSPATK